MNQLLLLVSLASSTVMGPSWERDFAHQARGARPRLEVRYTDASRTAFEVLAEEYHVTGELRRPNRLVDTRTSRPWLALSVIDSEGTEFRSENAPDPSRINLYRRGPYYCEVHWFDLTVADQEGTVAPLKGDLALYCYPHKLLASITWHATEAFAAREVRFRGLSDTSFPVTGFAAGTHETFAAPVFGEPAPLPAEALETLDASRDLHYDPVRGCYRIGSANRGGFQEHFYDHPDFRELVRFRVRNPERRARLITVCHESTEAPGLVEGGVVLDGDGHPLPLRVQVSKNFAGEKEERFYNPGDTPFSETFFQLYLEPGEDATLTSIHLYQNWGRHMTKHFSSLGAWMDYFHSSTGVTETTCYVPFKFAGLAGVSIADFRAMSQTSFWSGQPQHDNVAGHSFLSYHDGQAWQHTVYRGTTYHSTGPNWYVIGFDYLSADGKVRTSVETFEMPQKDELRNFIRVRCEVLEPLEIEDARVHFRLLTVTSRIQSLRYTHFACSGQADRELDFSQSPFPVRGVSLPDHNAFLALYGDPGGGNGIVVTRFRAPDGVGMAATVQAGEYLGLFPDKDKDTRLCLVPDTDTLRLEPGDAFEIDGFWMPFGAVDNADAVRREAVLYGEQGPEVVEVHTGRLQSGFPARVEAVDNRAQFVIRGGRDLVPVVVTGLTDYRVPRIERRSDRGWTPLSHARVGDLDGVEVFATAADRFGAVFLVHSDGEPQELRVSAGVPVPAPERIRVWAAADPGQPLHHAAKIQAPWMSSPLHLRYPETLATDRLEFIDHLPPGAEPAVDPATLCGDWREGEAGSLWFQWNLDGRRAGGRLTPNEEDVDLEFWVENGTDGPLPVSLQFCPVLAGTLFADPGLERSWIHTGGQWVRMADTERGRYCHYYRDGEAPESLPAPWSVAREPFDEPVVAVTSEDGDHVFAIAWPEPRSILSNADIPCVHADPREVVCPVGRRVVLRGKVFLMNGTLDDLLRRVRREVLK